jgi:hypothetical protein
MNNALGAWSRRDLMFVGETLVPARTDRDHVTELLRSDESLVCAMLEDERLFERMIVDEGILLAVSPRLFFEVLLRRARRELERELFTVERRHQQNVVLFDAKQVVDLLSQPSLRAYLSTMLASFTRTNSMTVTLPVSKGVWRTFRVSDLDVDSLIRYAQAVGGEQRFWANRRIADACLFLAGVFPESLGSPRGFEGSAQPRLRRRSSLVQSLEDHEAYGRAFYRLAAEHRFARIQGLDSVLTTLSESFVLAKKPLTFLAERYLSLRKGRLFDQQPHALHTKGG